MCVSFDLPETIFGGKLYVCPVQLCSCKEKEWCRFYLRNLKLRFSIYVWTWSSFHRYHISVDVICFNVNHYIYLFCLLPFHILSPSFSHTLHNLACFLNFTVLSLASSTNFICPMSMQLFKFHINHLGVNSNRDIWGCWTFLSWLFWCSCIITIRTCQISLQLVQPV